jgi:hypothetical protein
MDSLTDCIRIGLRKWSTWADAVGGVALACVGTLAGLGMVPTWSVWWVVVPYFLTTAVVKFIPQAKVASYNPETHVVVPKGPVDGFHEEGR